MKCDILVIGGGHAGIEAAYIAASQQFSTILVTGKKGQIGHMSCNPAVGGIAKGNLVREIDALGGVMGKIIDEAGIHFKMLNSSKGAAVWGLRAQACKKLYKSVAQRYLNGLAHLHIVEAMAVEFLENSTGITGVVCANGEKIHAKKTILCAGTFLNGVAHIGKKSIACGRNGEQPSRGLTESLVQKGLKTARLKTGTSPRIYGDSVDFSKMQEQPGDANPWPFSFSSSGVSNKTSCWITETNQQTHSIIHDNISESAMYSGKIEGVGPRYCPSIEDKIVRFADKQKHNLFIEPEFLDWSEVYINGLSTSLPEPVQLKMVRSIKGFEQAKIKTYGYAIEYDFFHPQQLHHTLEVKSLPNLYLAGQINATTGYEEAACQGAISAINACESLRGNPPFVLKRHEAYIGVLIDELVSKGTKEPFRMFTSRAEYRITLRQDNCDQRLMPLAYARGFIPQKTFDFRRRIWKKREQFIKNLRSTLIKPEQVNNYFNTTIILLPLQAFELLKRPTISLQSLIDIENPFSEKLSREDLLTIEADVKYEGFVKKQSRHIEKMKNLEKANIPDSLDFNNIPGLLTESREKLNSYKPKNMYEANQIPGVTPADISIVMVYISKLNMYSKGVNVSRETKAVSSHE